MVIELRVVQFWSEIILVISNRTRAARSFDFEITRMISDQIALHSVQLPLFIKPHYLFIMIPSGRGKKQCNEGMEVEKGKQNVQKCSGKNKGKFSKCSREHYSWKSTPEKNVHLKSREL